MKTHHVLNLTPSVLSAPSVFGCVELASGNPAALFAAPLLASHKERGESFRATPVSPARQDDDSRVCQRFAPDNVHGENISQRQTTPYDSPAWDVVASRAASPGLDPRSSHGSHRRPFLRPQMVVCFSIATSLPQEVLHSILEPAHAKYVLHP